MTRLFFKLLFLTFYFIQSHSMMIRNDALISKMVSDFQKDNSMATQQQHEQKHEQRQHEQHQHHQNPKDVLAMMQNVLCKNFPTVPCDMIVEDETLKNLIQRSIQQLKYKKMSMGKTTQSPIYHLTLFPSVNSEDLSNFLQVSNSGIFKNKEEKENKIHKKKTKVKINRDREPKKPSKSNSEGSRTRFTGRKTIRKYYPHKVKYKDKTKGRKDFGDYSEDKLSMSVEVPDMNIGVLEISRKRRDKMNYRADTDDGEDPVWRIDYLKHSDAGFNVFGSVPDRLKEKLVKTGPNVLVSDNIMEPGPRMDVMHPDLYIKKNRSRKTNLVEINSSGD